jgi:hypothetical protein
MIATTLGRATMRAEIPASATLKVPLFRTLIERLDDEARWVVLDLGAARTQTISLFGRFRCRLDIADIREDLGRLNGEPDPALLRETAEAVLPLRQSEPTDVVLCWDLLNYLDRPALTAVMSCIAARAHRGTLAHALIVYSDKLMPERPGQYVPLDEQTLTNLGDARPERNAPRYSPDDLARCMPAYKIERAMLLGNGMQEFLFKL